MPYGMFGRSARGVPIATLRTLGQPGAASSAGYRVSQGSPRRHARAEPCRQAALIVLSESSSGKYRESVSVWKSRSSHSAGAPLSFIEAYEDVRAS